jgi:hypothetical protein
MLKQDAATVHSEGPKQVIRDRFMFYLLCPLWVISEHVQCTNSCPLSANSGQSSSRHYDTGAVDRRKGEPRHGPRVGHSITTNDGWGGI